MTYRSFDTETWRDPWFEELKPMAKLLFIYLWTNDVVNQAGIYEITKKRIEFETGIKMENVIQDLSPKVVWDRERNIVWVKNFCKRQCANPQFFKGALKYVSKMPADLQKAFISHNKHLLEKYGIEDFQIPDDTHPIPYTDGMDTHPLSGTGSGSGTGSDKERGQKAPPTPPKPTTTSEKQKKFKPPTLEEVSAYCKERQNSINPKTFIAFYASKGWKVGKNGMKDWKSAVVSWEQRERKTYGDRLQTQNFQAAKDFLEEGLQ